ncbi:MAG: Spy/CpxP family protein refolding chaperone [Bacteroides sp.]|nr:Spy/CpxP family protein refolding chaperone [Bacteroides sp.]MCM1390372.1 Spy/CpxP family protein refolding chaperone [Bacteroides sp.]
MRRLTIISLLMLLVSAMSLHASDNRDKWFKELRQYKQEFMIKDLELTKEQQAKFFPIYSEMTRKIMKLNDDTRALENKIDRSKTEVSDVEYEKGAEALLELKAKEAKIEAEYYQKFKQILSPKQMYKLPKAEKKFTRQLMRHHNKAKTGGKKAPKTAFVPCSDCNA